MSIHRSVETDDQSVLQSLGNGQVLPIASRRGYGGRRDVHPRRGPKQLPGLRAQPLRPGSVHDHHKTKTRRQPVGRGRTSSRRGRLSWGRTTVGKRDSPQQPRRQSMAAERQSGAESRLSNQTIPSQGFQYLNRKRAKAVRQANRLTSSINGFA